MPTSSVPNYIFPPPKQEQAQEKKKSYVTNYVKGKTADVSLPQVATGGVVPFILGRDIVRNPDLIWYGNLKPITSTTSKQETVTDPNNGNETITTTYTTDIIGYTIDVQYSVGLGPGCRLRSIIVDDVSIWTGTQGPARATFNVVDNPVIKGVIFAGGNFDQPVDTYLQSVIPQAIPAYRGLAYVVLQGLDTSKLGNLAFEVDRYPDVLALGASNKIGDDINVVSAIASVITTNWGGGGQDASVLGASFNTLATTIFTENNGCSLIIKNIASANDINSILLDQIDATLWEDHDTGKIEITPYRKNFDRSNLLRIFDRDIIKIDQMQKTGWATVPTSISVSYTDRAQNYADIPITARNLATSDKVSKSVKSLSFPAVRVGTLAAQILAREGANSGSPIQQITLTTNRKTADCNPGDIILITCEKYQYFSVPMVVTKRRTQPIEDDTVTLTGNVVLYPNNTVLFAAPSPSFFVPVDPNPRTPTAVKIISAPWAFHNKPSVYYSGGKIDANWNVTTDQPMFFGSAYNQSQQGMRIYYHNTVSNTDDILPALGSTTRNAFVYPTVAQLTTAINKYDNWDASNLTEQIVIKNIAPSDTMLSAILSAFSGGGTIVIFIDDEIFTIKKGVNTPSIVISAILRTATFTGVSRAAADTVAQDHAANTAVYITAYYPGEVSSRGFAFGVNVDYLCTGFASPKNTLTESPIGSALALSYVSTDRANAPLRPHNTKINGSRGTSSPMALTLASTATISWLIRGRSIANNFTVPGDLPKQTDASQTGEVLSGVHIAYRVWILDSAAVAWDCGATTTGADHTSLVITVPAGAAPGVGWLWVNAEFDAGAGLKVSKYQDRLPITLS